MVVSDTMDSMPKERTDDDEDDEDVEDDDGSDDNDGDDDCANVTVQMILRIQPWSIHAIAFRVNAIVVFLRTWKR